MKRFSGVLCLMVCAVGGACAQGHSPEAGSDQPAIVGVVGCLSQTGTEWILANATEPAVSSTSFTTPEEVKAAAEKPLGIRQYRLIGTSPFAPEPHKGHKMVVKGFLIKNGSDNRINLTSFQMLAETCAK
jgi:hypothetical protein